MSAARILGGAPFHFSEKTFIQEVLITLAANPESTVLVDTRNDERVTFGELHQMASAISTKLKELGIGPGDIVLIISNVTKEAFIFMLGIWLAGAASCAINPLLPIEEIQAFFEICSCRLGYVGKAFTQKVGKALDGFAREVTIVAPNGLDPILDLHEIMNQPAELVTHVDQPLGKEHCMSIMFTSGTTGVPKGVKCTDGTLLFNSVILIGSEKGERPLTSSPLYWISSCIVWTSTLIHGQAVHITDGLSPKQLLQVISEYKPSHWFTGPSSLIDMCSISDLDQYDTSSLDKVYVGGAHLLADSRRQITEKVFNGRNIIRMCYGSTEAGLVSMDRTEINPDSPCYASVGQVGNATTIKILDVSTGELSPPFVSGEICVKSPAIIKSYINKEITEDELDKDGFWHMGDIGYYDDDGYIYYQSRAKDIMKYRGQQIAPVELECIIQKHPDVIESAVVGKPSPEYGELPAAFVVLKPNSILTEQELFDFVSKFVIDEKKLRGGIYFVKSLPKSVVGKILRRDLINFFTT